MNSRSPCKQLDTPVDIEAVTVRIGISTPIFICVLYIPPHSSK